MFRQIISTTFWNTVGKGIGFIVPFFIAAWFGVGAETDVFFFVYGLILYVSGIFSDSLESNIVPFISRIKREEAENTQAFLNRLLSLSALAMLSVAVIFVLFARPVFSLVTRFPESSYQLLARLSLESSLLLVLLVLSGILAGILNANFKFWIPAVSPGIRAVVCIVFILIFKDSLGIHSVALGYVAGELARLFLFGYALARNNLHKFSLDFGYSRRVKEFFHILSFQVICMIAIGFNPVIDRAMASWLGEGKVSILQYADRLNAIPIAFIFSGLIVVLLSRWSDAYYEHRNVTALARDMHKALGIAALAALAISGVLFLFSRQVVWLAYARGKFSADSALAVRNVFICYMAGAPFYIMAQVVVRAHLVLHNTKALMETALLANASNIILNFILMRIWGASGIALSTSIVSLGMFFYLYWRFKCLMKAR